MNSMINLLKYIPAIALNTALASSFIIDFTPRVHANQIIADQTSSGSCSDINLKKHSKLIKELYLMALQNNPEISRLYHLWQSKIYSARADYASYFPSVSVANSSSFWYQQKEYYQSWNVDYQRYTNYKENYNYNMPANLDASIDITLLDFQKFSNTKSINSEARAAEAAYNNTVKNILLEVINSYIRFQVLNTVLDVSEEIVEEFERLSSAQTVLLEEGFATILDYTNQYNILLNSRASSETARKELKLEINKLKKMTLMELSHNDQAVKLPGPECIPKFAGNTRLYELAIENSDKLNELLFSADSINSKAYSSLYGYLPKIKAGYIASYQWQEGNLNGYDKSQEQYGTIQGSPYVKIELNFNLAGEEYQKYKSLKEDKNAVKSSIDMYKRDLEETLDNFLDTLKYSRSSFSDHFKVYQDSKSAINLLNQAIHTGFVDMSSFTQLQNAYYESVRSTATDISLILSSYASLNRFTGYSPDPEFPFQVYIPKEEI